MPNPLVSFWRKFDVEKPPFVHPEDLPVLRQKDRWLKNGDPVDFDTFIASTRFGDPEDIRLHLSLLPVPYVGDLVRAEIVVFLLNPGFSYSDYWAETKMPGFRKRLEENLQQSFKGVEFPFLYLDPEFCWHPGFIWWEKKLRDVVTEIAKQKFNGSYLVALSNLSRRLACLELVPYHSSSFGDRSLIEQLPSVKLARQFASGTLVPAANAHKCTLIVTRQAKTWGLPDGTKNAIVYEGGHTRGASLSITSRGGQAILRSYGIR
jgi:hypothetical protein